MSIDFHDSNFFITAARAYKANIWTAVFVAIGLLAVDWITTIFNSKFAEYFGPLVLGAIFAFAIHHTILFGEKAALTSPATNKPFNSFFGRSLIFFGALVLIIAAVFVFVFLTTGTQGSAEVQIGWALILILIIGMPLFGASFAIWGTMLPAAVAGADPSLAAAWQRAKGHFWYTFLRLALGPFLVEIAILTVVFLISYKFGPLDFLTESGAPNPVGILLYLIVQMANLYVTALAAAVLCKTYLRSQSTAP